jgi:hypothetical protein
MEECREHPGAAAIQANLEKLGWTQGNLWHVSTGLPRRIRQRLSRVETNHLRRP